MKEGEGSTNSLSNKNIVTNGKIKEGKDVKNLKIKESNDKGSPEYK